MKFLLSSIATLAFICFFVQPIPAFRVYANMVLVPEGDFWMGSTLKEAEELKLKYGKRDTYRKYPFEAESPKKKI